jgi:hypothetical protein
MKWKYIWLYNTILVNAGKGGTRGRETESVDLSDAL